MEAILDTVASASASVLDLLPPQAVLSYVFVTCFLLYLMLPHAAALSKPRLNMKAVRNTNWKQVPWVEKIKETMTGKKYTVIGCGFLGKRLVHSLLLRGETHVTVFDMDPSAGEAFKHDARVTFVRGNVCDYEAVRKVVEGADVVYSTFAIIRFMDRFDHQMQLSFRINVGGTENVVKACTESNVKLLIQTSTSNCCVALDQTTFSMDEKSEYVTRENTPNAYGFTKAVAEQIVLKADKTNGMRTAALRPCSAVIGSEDKMMLETMLNLGRTILPPSGGGAVIDFVYVNNVVYGHFLLEKALWEKPDEGIAGEAFCVSNNNPMRMLDLTALVNVLRPGGVISIPTPERLMKLIAIGVETIAYFGFQIPGQLGLFTKTTCDFLDMSYVFSSRKAATRLGYEPLFTVEEAVQMAVEEWQLGQALPALS